MRNSRLAFALVLALGAACGNSQPSSGPPPATPASAEPTAVEPDPAAPAEPAEPAAAAATIDKATLIGSWKTTGTDFEELSLEADGSWSSFLHARPMDSGTWTLEGDTLTLAADAGDPIVVSGVAVDGKTLTASIGDDKVSWSRVE